MLGFAYPYGNYNPRVREAVIAAGYQYAATCWPGALAPHVDPFTLPRVNIRWNTLPYFLRRKIGLMYAREITNFPQAG